jgi:uncharacterized protein DUF1737
MAAEYTLVTGTDHQSLVNKVNAAIKNGWQPQGGLTVVFIPPDLLPAGADSLIFCPSAHSLGGPVNAGVRRSALYSFEVCYD